MNLNQILKHIEEKNRQWDEILKGERKSNPNPELHPGNDIAELLEQALHHPEFPRDLDLYKRCKDLIEEVEAAVPKFFPTLECPADSTSKKVISHVSNFLVRVQSPLTKEPGDETYHSPTELAELFDIPQENRGAFRKKLERLRRSNDDCFTEKAQRKPREAKYIYKLKYVRPIAEEIRNRSD